MTDAEKYANEIFLVFGLMAVYDETLRLLLLLLLFLLLFLLLLLLLLLLLGPERMLQMHRSRVG